MLPEAIIRQWEARAPWRDPVQVEHDLVMSRILVEMFQDEFLSEHLIFRGGTAINKFYFSPKKRFSEDLDFSQFHEGPIKPIQSKLLRLIENIEGINFEKSKRSRLGWKYFFDFEPEDPTVKSQRLKIEINTRDHSTLFGRKTETYTIDTQWFSGESNISTVSVEGLMTGKMVALYDRKKGRDLFDLAEGLKEGIMDPEKVVKGFVEYLERDNRSVSRAEFEMNLSEKLKDDEFRKDVEPTLTTDIEYSPDKAVEIVHAELIQQLAGDPYQGEDNIFL